MSTSHLARTGVCRGALTLILANAGSRLRSARASIESVIAVLRSQPFNVSTEIGRSKERYRRAALAGIAAGAGRGIRILGSVVTVPVTVGYLGAERFGLWMSLSSLIALAFGVADLGLGSTLQNVVSAANGRNDPERMKRDLSSAFFVMLAAPLVLLALFLALHRGLPWSRIFNLRTSLAAHEVGPAVSLFVVCYLAAIPLGVAARVQAGFQEGFRLNTWDCLAGSLGLVGTLLAARFRASLPVLVLASSGLPLVAMAVNSGAEFGWRRSWLRPRWRCFEWRRGRALMGTGVSFLVSSVGSLALSSAPVLVIGNRFGAAQVGAYALTFKILAIPMLLFSLFWFPLWPAYADAHARGDYGWMHLTLRRSRQLALFVEAPIVGAIGLAMPWLVAAWTGGRLRPSLAEACATAVFVMFVSLSAVYAVPVLACGRVRVLSASMAVVGVMAFLPMAVPVSALPVAIVPLWVAGCEALALAVCVWECRRLGISIADLGAGTPGGLADQIRRIGSSELVPLTQCANTGGPVDAGH
jgi:O-antigen/teichoic acid export membrane protein